MSSISWVGSEVTSDISWPLPQVLCHHYPGLSFRQGRLKVKGLMSGLVSTLLSSWPAESLPKPTTVNAGRKVPVGTSHTSPCSVSCVGAVFSNEASCLHRVNQGPASHRPRPLPCRPDKLPDVYLPLPFITPLLRLQVHDIMPGFWHGFWGCKFRSSHWPGKCLTERVVSVCPFYGISSQCFAVRKVTLK